MSINLSLVRYVGVVERRLLASLQPGAGHEQGDRQDAEQRRAAGG